MSPGPGRRLAAPAALLLYVLGLYGATALLQDGLFERDGYYHARVSQLLPERGSPASPGPSSPPGATATARQGGALPRRHGPLRRGGRPGDPGTALPGAPLHRGGGDPLVAAAGPRGPLAGLLRGPAARLGGLFLARLGMILLDVLSMALLLVGLHLLLQRRWKALFWAGVRLRLATPSPSCWS